MSVAGDGGGLRFDEGKPRYDLIPPEALDALAEHFGKGAQKYADRNWERGMAWGKCFASLMRHGWAWMRGEDCDPETGTHHMIAVAWNAIALFTYSQRKIGTDDRPNKPEATACSGISPAPTASSPVDLTKQLPSYAGSMRD